MNGKVLCFLGLALLGVAAGQPAKGDFKVFSLLDSVFKNQASDSVEIVRNDFNGNHVTGRAASGDFLDDVQEYLQSHDVTFKLPVAGAQVTVSPRNLDDEELNVNVKFADEARSSGVEPRKSKLKKILIPILVFIMLKAITVVPLILGALGLKAFNALQLAFFSFVITVALSVFQLCKKIAADNSPPQLSHGGWEAASAYRARSMDEDIANAQNMAYKAYA